MARKSGKAASNSGQQGEQIRVTAGDKIMRRVEDIIPYARNAKIHSEAQVQRLRASLREFGFARPLLTDEQGNLLAGHGTLQAAKAEGMTEVPCVVLTGLTESQKRAYILADNKLAELAAWDEAMLSVELEDLNDGGFDLELTGFCLDDLPNGEEPEEGPDEPTSPKLNKHYICPNCGHEFEAK